MSAPFTYNQDNDNDEIISLNSFVFGSRTSSPTVNNNIDAAIDIGNANHANDGSDTSFDVHVFDNDSKSSSSSAPASGRAYLNTLTEFIIVDNNATINEYQSDDSTSSTMGKHQQATASSDALNHVIHYDEASAEFSSLALGNEQDADIPMPITSVALPAVIEGVELHIAPIAPALEAATSPSIANADDDISSVTTGSDVVKAVSTIPSIRSPFHPHYPEVDAAAYDQSAGDYMRNVCHDPSHTNTPFEGNPFESATLIFAHIKDAQWLRDTYSIDRHGTHYATQNDLHVLSNRFTNLQLALSSILQRISDVASDSAQSWTAYTSTNLMQSNSAIAGLHAAYNLTPIRDMVNRIMDNNVVSAALKYENLAYTQASTLCQHISWAISFKGIYKNGMPFYKYLLYFTVLLETANHTEYISDLVHSVLQNPGSFLEEDIVGQVFNAMRVLSTYVTFFDIDSNNFLHTGISLLPVDITITRTRQALLARHVLSLHCLTRANRTPPTAQIRNLEPSTTQIWQVTPFQHILQVVTLRRHPGYIHNSETFRVITQAFQDIQEAALDHPEIPLSWQSSRYILILVSSYDAFGPNILRFRLGQPLFREDIHVSYLRAAFDIRFNPARTRGQTYSPAFRLWFDIVHVFKQHMHSPNLPPWKQWTNMLIILGYSEQILHIGHKIRELLQTLNNHSNNQLSPLSLLLDIPLRESDHALFLVAALSCPHIIDTTMLDLDPVWIQIREGELQPASHSLHLETPAARQRLTYLAPLLQSLLTASAVHSIDVMYPHMPSKPQLVSLLTQHHNQLDQPHTRQRTFQDTFTFLDQLRTRYRTLWHERVWQRLLADTTLSQLPPDEVINNIMQYLTASDMGRMFNDEDTELKQFFEQFPHVSFDRIQTYMTEQTPTNPRDNLQSRLEAATRPPPVEDEETTHTRPPLALPNHDDIGQNLNSGRSSPVSPLYIPTSRSPSPVEILHMLTVIPNEDQDIPSDNVEQVNSDDNSIAIAEDDHEGYYANENTFINALSNGVIIRHAISATPIAQDTDESAKRRRLDVQEVQTQAARNYPPDIGRGQPDEVPLANKFITSSEVSILCTSTEIFKSQSRGREIIVVGFYMHQIWITLFCIIRTTLRTGTKWVVNNIRAAKIAMFKRHKIIRKVGIPEQTIRNIHAWPADNSDVFNDHAPGRHFIINNFNEVPTLYKTNASNSFSRDTAVTQLFTDRYLFRLQRSKRVIYNTTHPSLPLGNRIHCVFLGLPVIPATTATLNLMHMYHVNGLAATHAAYLEGLHLSPNNYNININSPHVLYSPSEIHPPSSVTNQLLTLPHMGHQDSVIQVTVHPISPTLEPHLVRLFSSTEEGVIIDTICIAFINPQVNGQHTAFKINDVVLIPPEDLSLVVDNTGYIVAFCENEILRLANRNTQIQDHDDRNIFMPPVPNIFAQPPPPAERITSILNEFLAAVQQEITTMGARNLLRPIGPAIGRLTTRFETLATACADFLKVQRTRHPITAFSGPLYVMMNTGTYWNSNASKTHLNSRFGQRGNNNSTIYAYVFNRVSRFSIPLSNTFMGDYDETLESSRLP
jgi:hypothetical protein